MGSWVLCPGHRPQAVRGTWGGVGWGFWVGGCVAFCGLGLGPGPCWVLGSLGPGRKPLGGAGARRGGFFGWGGVLSFVN